MSTLLYLLVIKRDTADDGLLAYHTLNETVSSDIFSVTGDFTLFHLETSKNTYGGSPAFFKHLPDKQPRLLLHFFL